MEEFIKYILTNAPNFIGFALLAYILWRMNVRLMDAVLGRLDRLEEKVETLVAAAAAKNIKPRL